MPHDTDGVPDGRPRRLLRRLFDQLRRRAEAALLRLRQMQASLRARPAAAAPGQLAAGITLAVADVSRLSEELEAARAELSATQAGLEAELARRTAELIALNARLAASEDRLRLAQLHGRGGSWDWDVATGAMTWSEGFHALCGLDPSQATPSYEAWRDIIHPEDRAAAEGELRRGLEDRDERFHLEYRIAHPRRGVLWLSSRGRVSFDATGRPLHVLALVVDVTERREAEAKLAATNEALCREVAARIESEGRLRVLLDGIPQLVWRADGQGRWTWCSPQWIATTGLSEDRSLGEGWLKAVHPEDRAATLARWNAATPEAPYEGESRIHSRPHGMHRWFQNRAAPVRGETGEVVEWLGASTDIHALHQLQERQRILVAELQHRTRNLLAVVRGIAHQTIDEAASLTEFRALLDDRLRPLSEVQSLLSRSDAEPITLEALLRLELTAVGAEGERVSLAGPAVTLRNAAVQTLALALHELATNARKHGALAGPTGRLAIRWSVLADAGPDRLRLDWTETGVAPADRSGTRMGYGRELIERALPYSLGARTGFSLESDGLRCFIELPLE